VRLGGEEFLTVIAETDPAGAVTFAERLRESVAGHAFDEAVAGTTLHVTVSIGVAMFGLHGDTATALLRASDEAMYASKRAGRNRVTLAAGATTPATETT
jgi:diguanylate cyclase (GGDEF)-like protein